MTEIEGLRSTADCRLWLLAHGWFISDSIGWCWRCNNLIVPGQALLYEVDAKAGSVRGECCAPITVPSEMALAS